MKSIIMGTAGHIDHGKTAFIGVLGIKKGIVVLNKRDLADAELLSRQAREFRVQTGWKPP